MSPYFAVLFQALVRVGGWGVMSTRVRSLWSNIGQQTGSISHLSSRDDKLQKLPSIDVQARNGAEKWNQESPSSEPSHFKDGSHALHLTRTTGTLLNMTK